ncbi:MAG TPA: indole-3-glycerol phosphate synthase, partial [Lachnospiraceae bacterium]|nr:indole-3-glycerol phosphate synthase [Lachnospiraceae bacterium]
NFTISLETTKRLSKMLPEGTIFVSESGVTTTEDIEFLRDSKVNALLIGRAFMESKNPELLALQWKGVFAG